MSVDCVGQLGFHRPLTSLVKESLVVRNPNNRPVAFKIKTTAPKQYCVRPNSGRIEPGQEVEVQVLLQAMKEEPAMDTRCRDKFLVQSTIISAEHESSSISTLWSAVEAKNREDIHEKKIRCVFLAQDGSTGNHSAAHESYDGNNNHAASYHQAETSSSDIQQPQQNEHHVPQERVVEKSELFAIQPALASRADASQSRTTAGADLGTRDPSASVEKQLKEAHEKIDQLQRQLDSSKSGSRRGDVKSAVRNEGVPVPMTAMIALIAFMAAYLLF